MLSSAELVAALSVLEAEECGGVWAAAGQGGGGLVRALLAAGGQRAAAVLRAAPDTMARTVLEQLTEGLRAPQPAQRRVTLATTAPLLALRPAWLRGAPSAATSALGAALSRAARTERDPVPTLHALLSLAALVPTVPACTGALWPDVPGALLRASPCPHVRLGQLALFHALYATHPCTLLEALRTELASTPGARAAYETNLGTLLRSARLHPGLLSGSRQREADVSRWARAEPHDILAEAHALSSPLPAPHGTDPPPATPPPPVETQPGSVAWAALSVNTLRPGSDGWFALSEAVVTPVPVEAEPEAAVEATPENTPARETRAAFRFPAEGSGGAVRAIGRRSPRAEPSPPADAGTGGASGRLARVLSERRALESPVSFAAGAPAGVARPEPRAAVEPEEPAWEAAADTDPRSLLPSLPARAPRAPRRAPSAGLRAHSVPPLGAPRQAVAVQTDERWPEPYEFILADMYRDLPDDAPKAGCGESATLEQYLSSLVAGTVGSTTEPKDDMAEQLALTQASLMFERWRRDTHAERNRRLLGRVRTARGTALLHAQLTQHNQQLAQDCAELRARLAHARARPNHCSPPTDREKELEALVWTERSRSAALEARVLELEAASSHARPAAHHDKYEHSEEQIHLQSLARAAVTAGSRGAHIRRLQRHLLACAEREQRLLAAAAQPPVLVPPPRHEMAPARVTRSDHEVAALTQRLNEQDALIKEQEHALAEVRAMARAAECEHAARLQAMRDKYSALLQVLRVQHERHLAARAHHELHAAPRARPAPPTPSPPPPDGDDS